MKEKIKKYLKEKTQDKRFIGNVICGLLIAIGVLLFILGIKLYLNKIDVKAKEILEMTDTTYDKENGEVNYTGLYVANVKDDILKYAEGKDIKSVSYKLKDEGFYIDFVIEENKNGEDIVSITRIVADDYNINAIMNMKDIKSIEYRMGNSGDAIVLKINSEYSSEYFAMLEGTYYFLGLDIETISYIKGQFYYTSYNPNYLYLEEAKSCSKEVVDSIDGFNKNDYYYKYGKINFLPDYYQKLSSKTYTVGDKCTEFEEEKEEAKEEKE